MKISPQVLQSFAKAGGLLPQEEMLEIARKKGALFIGVPKETTHQENRVCLTPDAVRLLVANGHQVMVETKAGNAAHFSDRDYSEAGAQIVNTHEEVFKADIILKVDPPTPEEIQLMHRKQTIFSALQLTVQHENFLRQLMEKKVTALAFDYIKDEDGMYPIVRTLGEMAGTTSILIAAELLSNANKGLGLMLGGVSGVAPAEVVILGAGTSAEFAARAALGLGASVKVFDPSSTHLRKLSESLGQRIWTSTIQPNELALALKNADVAIGALRTLEGRAPLVVSGEMVQQMKQGSVIIDISIDHGGCFETSRVTSHSKPPFTEHGVVHYCVPNIPSRIARTASSALSNIFSSILLRIGEEGGMENYLRLNAGLRNGVYIYNGILTNKFLGNAFELPYKNIELLMAVI
ncbi:MAG: alanine dehydrogenase [Bacteroidia bacterium]|nr:alanine dehydrogenase [Bacteroidia bacterium]